MRQFFHANPASWEAIERRALTQCLRVRNQELPPGSRPAWSTIGFEIEPATGHAKLFVQQGIEYTGAHAVVRRWFDQGHLEFDTFQAMRRWVQDDLAAAYEGPPPREQDNRNTPESSPWPFVGYEEQLAEAQAVLEQLYAPSGVVVAGPSGVGKTGFVREVARRWRASGRPVVELDVAEMLAGAANPADRNARLHRSLASWRGARETLVVIEDLPLCIGWPQPDRHHEHWEPRRRRAILQRDRITCLVLRSAIDDGLKLCGTARATDSKVFNDPQLRRRIRLVRMARPSKEAMLADILPPIAAALGEVHRVLVLPAAIGYSVSKSGSRAQPGAAIRLLALSVFHAERNGRSTLAADDLR